MLDPVSAILAEKGSTVECAAPTDTVLAAVQQMNGRRIGALVVLEAGQPVGIFTERDVLTRVVAHQLDPAGTLLSAVMTRELTTITPRTTVQEAMMRVTDRRLRHLPVLDGGRLIGMISIGDLTRWVVRDKQRQIDDLEQYIQRG